MAARKLTKLELKIMEAFWKNGACSVREVRETFPGYSRPAYTTIQTTIYRLERKKVIRCIKWIGNAKVFEASVSRDDAQRSFVDELISLFSGRTKLVMAHLVASGELTLDDIKETEKLLLAHSGKDKSK